jgi:MerR family transcriptional regulator, light-induced transcriptional regulator
MNVLDKLRPPGLAGIASAGRGAGLNKVVSDSAVAHPSAFRSSVTLSNTGLSLGDQPTQQIAIGISAVERDTGLSKDTLRVWERRYGFPQPLRDAFGERIYPLDQVEKLRTIKRLMDRGFRPGKIIGHSLDELIKLGQETDTSRHTNSGDEAEINRYLAMIKAHNMDELRRSLSQSMLKVGMSRFIAELVAPLNYAVGEAWVAGRFEIFEEHLYTESMQVVLRSAIASLPTTSALARPTILLTTFPNEQHGLGLLMAEAMLAMEGARCISLGVETPILDIVLAATRQRCDVVALSFSGAYPANQVLDGLNELRGQLPRQIEIWSGGTAPVLVKRPPEEVRTLRSLNDIHTAITDWRARHAHA